jgi:ribosome-binding protein aMBF1 (putative translation factor)
MTARRNRDGAALSLFADVLQEARHAAGLNSDELGAKLGYSGAMIRSVESGHRLPKPELAKAADRFFGYPKIFHSPGAVLRSDRRCGQERVGAARLLPGRRPASAGARRPGRGSGAGRASR